MTPAGGTLRGLNTFVSNGIPDGQLVILDAAQIAANATAVDVAVSSAAALEMSDTPTHDSVTPVGTSLVSMFQTNSVALRVSATIAAQPLRDDCAVVITGVDWGA